MSEDNTQYLAWQLACRLFALKHPLKTANMSLSERQGLQFLREQHVVDAILLSDLRYILCPCCQDHNAKVNAASQTCVCVDCGEVNFDDEDWQAWQLKSDWMQRKLKAALNLTGRHQADLGHDAVRIGVYKQHPVVIAPSLDEVLNHPSVLERARIGNKSVPWIMTPKPVRQVDTTVLGSEAQWWSLEERFVFFAHGLSFISPGERVVDASLPVPCHGVFSADFRWVFLSAISHDPIHLSLGQAKVFKALWYFQSQPQNAERIMSHAQLDSAKPVDLFKIKGNNKGNSRHENAKQAYDSLVDVQKDEGLYQLSPLAIQSPV